MSQVGQYRGRERLTRATAALSLILSLAYIIWRWGWTLDTQALWLSVPLALAESYGLLSAAFFTFNTWRLRERSVTPPPAGRTVDVLITAYDEPINVIRKTALAARELRYPHDTWLLDDGHRDELRQLAVEMGIGYIKRADRTDAKGGNLNHALRLTSGEFILQLDADHLPLPHIIERMLGFFSDDRLAFVQSPQDLFDAEAFTQDVALQRRQLWDEDELFFRVIQPGRDRLNAASFVGSCGMIRRSAVEQIGGFGTSSVTEGVETSLLLHGRGWRSAYLGESLAFALSAMSARAFHLQEHHRAQGAMQTLRHHHPAATRGLTLAQRVCYLSAAIEPFGGFQTLVYFLAPLVFLTTGVFPVRARAATFAALFVPHLLLRLLSVTMLSRGHGALLLGERRRIARFFTDIRGVTAYVTPKSRFPDPTLGKPAGDTLALALPQIVLAALTTLALGWALYERVLGYHGMVRGWGDWALGSAVGLALWHAVFAVQVIGVSAGGRHRRTEHRFAESLAVTTRVFRADGKLASSDIAVTENLTPSGLALRCMYPIAKGSRIEMTLPLNTRQVTVRGRVVQQSTSQTQLGTVHVTGVEFDTLSQDTRDAIELHCAHHAMPLQRQRYKAVGRTARQAVRRLQNLRGEQRMAVGMPARVVSGSGADERELGVGLLEDVSPKGGRVLLDKPVKEGTLLTLQIPGSTVRASGRVVFVTSLETSLGTRYVAGFMTESVSGDGGERTAHWFNEMIRSTKRYGGAMMAGSRAAREAAGRAIAGVAARTASARKVAQPAAQAMGTLRIVDPGEPVHAVQPVAEPSGQPVAQVAAEVAEPASESVSEPGSEREDTDWIIDGGFTFPGELVVGGTFIVTETGRVSADIVASNAFIRGQYSGTLKANGTILVSSSARVTGVLDGGELVVLDGAVLNGEVAGSSTGAEPAANAGSEVEPAAATADAAHTWAPPATDEELDPDVEIFIPPRGGAYRAPVR